MIFRFTLSSSSLGSLVLEKNPQGWETMEVLIKRGLDTHGFFYEQAVNLSFYCGAGKEYIDEVRSIEGIDANISISIEIACVSCDMGEDAPDYSIDYSDDYGSNIGADCHFEQFYEGILDMKTWESSKNFTNVAIIESSFFQTVRNRLDTVVDLLSTETIDGTELDPFTFGPYDVNLHSKALLLESEIEMLSPYYGENITVPDTNQTLYFTYPFDSIVLEELPTLIVPTPPLLDSSAFLPAERFAIYYNNSGADEDYEIDYTIIGDFKEFLNRDRSYNLRIVYAISENNDVAAGGAVTLVDYGVKTMLASVQMTQAMNETGTLNITIPNGYFFYVYFVLANYDGTAVSTPTATLEVFNTETSFTFRNVSITDPSVGKAFARFEAGARISQVISNQVDSFRSSYFGRKNSEPYAYDENGCGSFAFLQSGFWVRGFPITGDDARTTKMSLNQYFKSNSAIENLGLGIEKIDDIYYIVMERMNYFYDSSTVLLTFNNVPDILIQEAEEYYTARVNIGYSKWETKFRNGLEEPNSKRFYDLGIKAVETEKNIYSDFVAGAYPLELIRRLQYIDSPTTDSDYDEENFIVCTNREVDIDGIPTGLDTPEKDENFDQVNNLLSPETSYNLRIPPSRNYLRHNDTINPALLKYPGRNVKFMGGEGNYKMTSELTDDSCPGNWNNELLGEGDNIQWDSANNSDNNPLWIPEIATFKFPLSFTDFKTLKANPKGVIMVSDTDADHIPYYILEVSYIPGNGGLASFKLLKAFQ